MTSHHRLFSVTLQSYRIKMCVLSNVHIVDLVNCCYKETDSFSSLLVAEKMTAPRPLLCLLQREREGKRALGGRKNRVRVGRGSGKKGPLSNWAGAVM